jgi:cobalt-zinc-cadmium efflux system membrane fusion protein
MSLRDQLKVNGYLELPPQGKAVVSAVYSGQVAKILIGPGEEVEQGQVLAYLKDPTYLEKQKEYLKAQADLAFYEQELLRKQELAADEIIPQKDLQLAETNYTNALTDYTSLQIELMMIGIDGESVSPESVSDLVPVRAAIGGSISQIHCSIGTFVQEASPLFEIIDNHHLHIDFSIYEKDLPYVSVGQSISFNYSNNPHALEATVFALGKSIDPVSKAVAVHAEIEDPAEGILPGMFVEGRISTAEEVVPVISVEAIVRNEGLDYVFVLEGSDESHWHFKPVEVFVGMQDQGFAEVAFSEDLPEGSRFVVKGSFYLMSEVKSMMGGGDAGHHH